MRHIFFLLNVYCSIFPPLVFVLRRTCEPHMRIFLPFYVVFQSVILMLHLIQYLHPRLGLLVLYRNILHIAVFFFSYAYVGSDFSKQKLGSIATESGFIAGLSVDDFRFVEVGIL